MIILPVIVSLFTLYKIHIKKKRYHLLLFLMFLYTVIVLNYDKIPGTINNVIQNYEKMVTLIPSDEMLMPLTPMNIPF